MSTAISHHVSIGAEFVQRDLQCLAVWWNSPNCKALQVSLDKFSADGNMKLQGIASLFGQIQRRWKYDTWPSDDRQTSSAAANFTRPKQSKTFSHLMTPQLLWFCKLVLHIMMWFTNNINYPMCQPPVCSSRILKLIHKIETSLALYTEIPTDLESETTANQKTREVKWSKLATHTNHTRNNA